MCTSAETRAALVQAERLDKIGREEISTEQAARVPARVKTRHSAVGELPTLPTKNTKNMTKEENKARTTAAVAEMIRNAREALGWTLYKLSKETGIAEGHLSKIEAGKIVPRVDMLQRITKALRVCIAFPLEFRNTKYV